MALLSIQIDHHAGTPKQNTYNRRDKLGYNSVCYIGSSLRSDVCQRGSLQVIDIEAILEN